MPRRYRRRRYAIARPVKTAKYSNETYAVNDSVSGINPSASVFKNYAMVPITNVLATRKVKNFTLRIGIIDARVNTNPVTFLDHNGIRLHWALVYVPQGTNASDLTPGVGTPTSLYEPNQNVIMSGFITDHQTYTYKTRLARNLNSQDGIVLRVEIVNEDGTNTEDVSFLAQLNYAISY